MTTADTPLGWQSIENQEQIQHLMSLFGDFHDACIREIHVATGHVVDESLSMAVDWKTTIHLLIQRQFRPFSAVELRFEEVTGMGLSTMSPTCVNIIIRAEFLQQDGVFYWAETGGWTPGSSIDCTWVAAREVSWRDASEWMGASLRYRTNAD